MAVLIACPIGLITFVLTIPFCVKWYNSYMFIKLIIIRSIVISGIFILPTILFLQVIYYHRRGGYYYVY